MIGDSFRNWNYGDPTMRNNYFKRTLSSARIIRRLKQRRFDYLRLEDRQLLTTFYVDNTGGSDGNNGLGVNSAFETIQRAANLAQPGDVVEIRAGVYREQVSLPRSGVAGQPILFRAFNNEEVTVTATDRLSGFTQTASTTDNPNVYVANLSGSNTNSLFNSHELTVFVDGEVVQSAKNRNSADYLRSDTWSTVNASAGNQIQDTDLVGVGDLTGGFIRVLINDFAIRNFKITTHDRSSGIVTLDRNVGNVNGRPFLAHDALSLVDSPGEWYFDEDNNQLYLYAPGGGNPNNRVVEVKRRAEAFNTNGNDYLQFQDLRLTGGDFQTFSNNAFSGPQSNHLLIDNVHVIAPDRIFSADFGTTRTALTLSGDNNIVRNSEFEQIWSVAIRVGGSNNQIVNNFIHDAAFNGGGAGGLALNGNSGSGGENLVSHNTFTRHGRSAIVVRDSQRDLVQHNSFSEVALITADTGAVYVFNSSFGHSVYRFNTFFDIDARLSTGFYVDNFVTDVAFHNNVIYNASAFGFKANQPNAFILQYNNTAFNNGRFDIAFASFDSQYGSRFYNNITSAIDSDAPQGSDPLDVRNNFISSASSNFQNAGAGDFRLRSNSNAIDRGIVIPGITDGFSGDAPDAGAIEFGDPLFVTGHNFSSPPNPTYDLGPLVFGSNLVFNSGFEQGFQNYSITGNPAIFQERASDLRDAALNRYGGQGALLSAGDAVTQTVTGLKPNTTYTAAAYAKPIRSIIEAESRAAGSTVRPNGNVRGKVTVSGLQNDDVLVYDNVDFGDGQQFNELTLQIANSNTSASVQLRLDSPSGPVIGSTSLPSDVGLVRSSAAIDVSGVTGTRSIFLIFSGSGTLGQLESLRFTNSADKIQLRATNFGGDEVIRNLGRRVHENEVQRLTFTTGPSATSADLSLSNSSGNDFSGYVDYLTLTEGDNPDSTFLPTDLTQTVFDYDLGSETSPVLTDFTRVSPDSNGVAFFTGENLIARDRSSIAGINAANRDFIEGTTSATFNHDLVNGRYRVAVNLSDPLNDLDNLFIRAEGVDRVTAIDRPAGQNSTIGFNVDVLDGQLNLEFGDADSVNARWVVNRISIDQLSVFASVDLTQTSYFYDVGTPDSPVFTGNSDDYVRVSEATVGDIEFTTNGPNAIASFDREANGQIANPAVNDLNRDQIQLTSPATFRHRLADGIYRITITAGDATNTTDAFVMSADEENSVSVTTTAQAAESFSNFDLFDVRVSDGELNLNFDNQNGVANINRIIIRRTGNLPTGSISGRFVFYNDSSFDGDDPSINAADDTAIATDKTALLPGQTATFENYTSYVNGVNGVIVDIENLANPSALSASDFVFSVGNGSDQNDFSLLTTTPTVSVRTNAGVSGSDRVTVTFPSGTVTGQWLAVTVLANGITGLNQNDLFYFGNAIGDTGDSSSDARVGPLDENGVRNNGRNFLNPADVENVYDFDRNGVVFPSDENIARINGTNLFTNLQLITAPGSLQSQPVMLLSIPAPQTSTTLAASGDGLPFEAAQLNSSIKKTPHVEADPLNRFAIAPSTALKQPKILMPSLTETAFPARLDVTPVLEDSKLHAKVLHEVTVETLFWFGDVPVSESSNSTAIDPTQTQMPNDLLPNLMKESKNPVYVSDPTTDPTTFPMTFADRLTSKDSTSKVTQAFENVFEDIDELFNENLFDE